MRPRFLAPISLVCITILSGCLAAEPTSPPAPSSAPSVPPASASPISPPTAPSSAEPTPPPAATPVPAPSGLRPDSFARVATDGLRVRTMPSTNSSSHKLEPLLWNEALLFVVDGPVAGSGYDWYLVEPVGEVDVQVHPDPPAPGWVAAAARDGTPWLAPAANECYETPLGWLAFDLLDAPIGLSGLSCFGDRSLQFSAALAIDAGGGCNDMTGPWTISPAWLGPCHDPVYDLADPSSELTDETHALEVTIAPSVDVGSLSGLEPDQWLLVDVVGQFAHPAASSCRATPTGGDGEGPPRPELVVLNCREQFVVTSLAVHVDP